MRTRFDRILLVAGLLLAVAHLGSFAHVRLAGAAERVHDEGYRALSALKTQAPVAIKIIDTKGPVNPLTFVDIILLIAELALLVFIVDWIIRFARRRISEAKRVTPYETARKELHTIKSASAKKTMLPRECSARISAMLKGYIKDALKMGSSEFTTADFLRALRPLNAAPDGTLIILSELLSLSDLVKFSGRELSQKEIESNIESADAIIKSFHIKEAEDKGPKKP